MLVLQFEYLFAVAVEGVCPSISAMARTGHEVVRDKVGRLIGKMDICRQSAACARNSKRIFKTPRLRSEAKLITHHNSTQQRVFPFSLQKEDRFTV
jgi:hypothetical protein